MVFVEGFDQIEPTLLRRADGGWLAVSPREAALHIGVAAWSVEEARRRFVRELREWQLLLDGQGTDEQLA